MSQMGLGRVKTPACNLRVEIPSRFRQLENQKYCDDYQEKTIEKTILRILGSCTFSRSQGHSRRFDDVRAMSGLPPIATELRTLLEVRFVPILLKKSFLADVRNF
jgi:hypothetical protein